MLELPVLRLLALTAPGFLRGAWLHRRGLVAASHGQSQRALVLFELAASRYRAEVSIEPLARLRVHELLVRATSPDGNREAPELMLQIVSKLNRLDRLESLEAPFALEDARTVLSRWIERESPAAALASAA